ncbi:MAG: hypothetical protein QNK62_01005 [Cryomorphaceae bacterium]|jgi:hypothetical protein|nr:hypothetical protein [Cryomorphaceae bacterium]
MRSWSSWGLCSLLILLFQSLILCHVQLYGYLSPYLYIGVILLAPASWTRMNLVLLGALTGAWIDFTMHSGGMHLMASSLLGYVRPQLLASVLPRAAEEDLGFTLADIGPGKWIIYTGLSTAIHHTYLFAVDAYGLWPFIGFMGRIFFSSLATAILLYILGLMIKPVGKR